VVKSGVESFLILSAIRVLFLLAITFGAFLSWWFIPISLIFIPVFVKLLFTLVFFYLNFIRGEGSSIY